MVSGTKWIFIVAIIAMCGAWAVPREASAQFAAGPVAGAMGEAGRAAVDPGEVTFLNPASVAHLQRYYGSFHYFMGWHPVNGNTTQFGVLLADGSPEAMLPGSLSYIRRKTELANGFRYTEQDLQFALGEFVLPQLAFGIAAHRLIYQPSSGDEHEQTNGHLGLLYTPFENFGLSFNAYDIIPASESVPIGIRVVPTFAIGSHVIIMETLRLRLDFVRPDKFNENRRTNVSAGLETYFRDDFAFRLGGFWRETADQMFVTTGLGFRGPRLSFDYSFQRDVRQSEGSRHLFDLWLPF